MWLNILDKAILALKLVFFIFAIFAFFKPSIFEFNKKIKKTTTTVIGVFLFVVLFLVLTTYSIHLNIPAEIFGEPNALNFEGENIESSNTSLFLGENKPLYLTLVLEEKPITSSINLIQSPKDLEISITDKLSLEGTEGIYSDIQEKQISFPSTLETQIPNNALIQSAVISTLTKQEKINKEYSSSFTAPQVLSFQLPKNSEIISAEISLQVSQQAQGGITGNAVIGDTECNSCSDCEQKINSAEEGQTIYLTQDISANTSQTSCMVLTNKKQFTFDCQDNKIKSTSAYNDNGIYLEANSSVIQNCNFEGFERYQLRISSNIYTEIKNSNFYLTKGVVRFSAKDLLLENSEFYIDSSFNQNNDFVLNLLNGRNIIVKDSKFIDKRINPETQVIAVYDNNIQFQSVLIYNNYFENPSNGRYPIGGFKAGESTVIKAYEEKSCTSQNIVGGPCQGGNYYNFTNSISKTCTDLDVDGICDQNITFSAGSYYQNFPGKIQDKYPLTIWSGSYIPIQPNQTEQNTTTTNTTIITSTGNNNVSIYLNSKLIFSTNETKNQILDIQQQIKDQLTACQTELCNINLDFQNNNLNFKGDINIQYSTQDYPQILLNKKPLLIGNNVDISSYLEETHELSFESQSNIQLKVNNLEINYILFEKTQDISEQINTYCKTYPCHIPVKISSQSGGEVLITLNKQ